METDNFNRTLTAFRRRVPFRPFTVVLVNGDRYEIDFAEAFAVRDGMSVYVSPGGTPVLFDHEGVAQVIGGLKDDLPSEPGAA